jgi:tRNA(fMet)-specific endonuclease VapC
MYYVLDTNICRLLMEKQAALTSHIDALPEDDLVCTTMISFGESIGGWLPRCRRARNGAERSEAYEQLYEVFTFYRRMICLRLDDRAAEIFDQLRTQKIRIGTNDLAIAAITLSVSGVLITRNTVDFERVPNLIIEDWTK